MSSAKVIAFDIHFEGESQFDDELAKLMLKLGNVIVGQTPSPSNSPSNIYSAVTTGFLDIPEDSDRIIRRYKPLKIIKNNRDLKNDIVYRNYYYEPSFVFRILQKLYCLDFLEHDNRIYGINSVNNVWEIDPLLKIPTENDKTFYIKGISKKSEFQKISYVDIYEGNFDNSLVDNNILLIGSEGQWSNDSHHTPYGKISGLKINALALNTIITNSFVRYYNPIFQLLILCAFSFLFIFLFPQKLTSILVLIFAGVFAATSNYFSLFFPISSLLFIFLFGWLIHIIFNKNISAIYKVNRKIQKIFILGFCSLILITGSVLSKNFEIAIGYICSLAVTISYDLFTMNEQEGKK